MNEVRLKIFAVMLLGSIFILGFGMHSVKASGLEAGGQNGVNPQAAALRFAVIGDYGYSGQPEADVAERVKSWNPDLIVTVGDNNYDWGAAGTIDANIGQYYHDFIYPYTGSYGAGAATNDFFPALGNHDWYSQSPSGCYASGAHPYLNYFSLPGNERYYEVVREPVHFFALDSDPCEPDGIASNSAQAAWLQGALAASSAPWKVVLLHHAPFSSGLHGSTAALQWPYEAWGADAVLAGHDHTYERIVQGSFPYFVNGLGGRSRYAFGEPIADSQQRYNSDYGAMLVGATAANLDFQFVTRSGETADSYSLSNNSLTPPDPVRITFQQIATGFSQPVAIAHAGDGSGRIFVVERAGVIRIIQNGTVLGTPFLDITASVKSTGGEQGLLSLAFHPSYGSNGYFYVLYTAPGTGDGSILTVERYTVSGADPDVADPDSASIVHTIPHPDHGNHNGGSLAFGPDGYLYWSTGDGGGGGDPGENGQDKAEWLGKVLRLDVDPGPGYMIPTTNPFFGDPDPSIKEEIWAYGFRNPWRLTFDRLTGDIYIGDVGQGSWEEIDFQPWSSAGGENYGWDVMEGSHCYEPATDCDQSGKILPVAEYPNPPSTGAAVTGGYVYRGPHYPELQGFYFYADVYSGWLTSLYNDATLGWQSDPLVQTSYTITTFGEDEDGELYVVDYGPGVIYQIQYTDLEISPGSLNFGNQLRWTSNPPQVVTLTNNNTVDGIQLGMLSTTNTQFTLSNDTCSNQSLAPNGGSCTVGVVFKPTSTGVKNATLNIPSDATGNPHSRALTGTGVAGTQLLLNRSMETDSNGDQIPNNWIGLNLNLSQDGRSSEFAKDLSYSFKMFGEAGNLNKILRQNILKSGVAGDDFYLSAWSKADSVPGGGKYRATVTILNGSTVILSRTVSFGSGTHDWEIRSKTITAPSAYTKVRVDIYFQKLSGMAWFDLASLTWAP